MTITPASLQKRGPRSPRGHCAPGYNTPGGATFPEPLSPRQNRCWPEPRQSAPVRTPDDPPRRKSGRKRFPFNNFTCCLTLFSKCFSSFDHSTCALSVSGQYLALEEIYLPFRAAFPNNSTRRRSFTWARQPIHTGFSPSMTSCSKELRQAPRPKHPLQITTRAEGQISNLSCCRFTRRY